MPKDASVKQNKQEMRKLMLQKRRQVSAEEQQRVSAVVAEQLGDLLADYPDGAVLSYLAYGREIDLGLLHEKLWQQGRSLCVPKTANLPKGEMQAVAYPKDCRMIKTELGVFEPLDTAEVLPQDISVVIVPGVAFDPKGGRLGHGMGYYDRFLPKTKGAVWVGVCYAWQLIENVPQDEFDCLMHRVICG